jgi:hypothetical protein
MQPAVVAPEAVELVAVWTEVSPRVAPAVPAGARAAPERQVELRALEETQPVEADRAPLDPAAVERAAATSS